MLRKIKVPEYEHKFDEELFQKELYWLKRVEKGLVISSSTSPAITPIVISSTLVTLVFGTSPGAALAIFANTFTPMIVLTILVFAIAFYFQYRPYSELSIDTEQSMMEYKGIILYAGEERTTRYRGSVEVIEGTELVKKKRKYFIRFITNSGYMIVNYLPGREDRFLNRLEELGLCNLAEMKESINNKKEIEIKQNVVVLYRIAFDRTEFKKQLREKREQELKKLAIEAEERKRRLLERSKKHLSKNKN